LFLNPQLKPSSDVHITLEVTYMHRQWHVHRSDTCTLSGQMLTSYRGTVADLQGAFLVYLHGALRLGDNVTFVSNAAPAAATTINATSRVYAGPPLLTIAQPFTVGNPSKTGFSSPLVEADGAPFLTLEDSALLAIQAVRSCQALTRPVIDQ
jgi:hypothetical protein